MAGREKQLFGFDAESIADNGRATRAVLGKSRSYAKRYQTANIGGQRSVAVELLEDMDADDTEAKPAKLMTLAGGSWTDTKQRVLVRNVGAQSLASGTRCIAWPVANLGLCVHVAGGGELGTLNVGMLASYDDALLAARTQGINSVAQDLQYGGPASRMWPTIFTNAILYPRLTGEELLESTFSLAVRKPLHVLVAGCPASIITSTSNPIYTSSYSAEYLEALAATHWTPAVGSFEEAAVDVYLANGGTVVLFVDPPQVFDSAAGYDPPESQYTIDTINRFNVWLEHLGSEARIILRTDTFPHTVNASAVAPQVEAVLPKTGIFTVNPDTWLGRSEQQHRIVNYNRKTLSAYLYAQARASEVSYFEDNAAFVGDRFYSATLGTYDTNKFPNLYVSPWTSSDIAYLSAPESIINTAATVARRYATDPHAFPEDTHARGAVSGSSSSGGLYQFVRRLDSTLEYFESYHLPTSTAERLPGGGKLIVFIRSVQALVSSQVTHHFQAAALKKYTRHLATGPGATAGAGIDRADHRFAFASSLSYSAYSARIRIPVYSRTNTITAGTAYCRTVYKGEGFAFGTLNEFGETLQPGYSGYGKLQTIENPAGPAPVQYLVRADAETTTWTGFGGSTLWQRVATETATDSEWFYSAVGSSSRATLFLEVIAAFPPNQPVTLRVRAAKCDASGALTGSGSCDLAVRLIASGSLGVAPVYEQSVSLSGSWQTFEFVLDPGAVVNLLKQLTAATVAFVPTSSGCGAAISWIALETAAAESFPALMFSVDRRLHAVTAQEWLNPWRHTWNGVHPEFGGNALSSTAFSSGLFYPRADVETTWGHAAARMLPGSVGHYPQLAGSTSQFYRGETDMLTPGSGAPLTQPIGGLLAQEWGVECTVTSYHDNSIYAAAVDTTDGFPVVFQNGRFLRPRRWVNKSDEVLWNADSIYYPSTYLWRSKRAASTLRGWEDISNWPDIDTETTYNIETEPDSPPVCFGAGAELQLPYGMNGGSSMSAVAFIGPFPYTYGYDLFPTVDTDELRAFWQANYGGSP